ncbi:MAG: ArsR/SmtB family transcription factor [Armatimonadota bacterium]
MAQMILERNLFACGEIFKALASDTRLRILRLLAEGDLNVNEIARALGLNYPTVSKHVQALEQAGLVDSEYMAGSQGAQKRCRLRWDKLIFSLENESLSEQVEEVSMAIGMYTLANPSPTCGLASRDGYIGLMDDPQSFLLPERANAELLWMGAGFVEYMFPNFLPTSVEITRVEVVMEICSEAPDYNNDYPSDITLWINGVEVGTWTCPGDFGGKRGRLNPHWWNNHGTQFGVLKVWSVSRDGSYIDGIYLSDVTVKDVMVLPQQPVTVRIGNKPDAKHIGGFNLFGKGFGNYEQDLLLRLHYAPIRITAAGEVASEAVDAPLREPK